MPSCMRAPPAAENMIRGASCSTASLAAEIIASAAQAEGAAHEGEILHCDHGAMATQFTVGDNDGILLPGFILGLL